MTLLPMWICSQVDSNLGVLKKGWAGKLELILNEITDKFLELDDDSLDEDSLLKASIALSESIASLIGDDDVII